MAAPGVWTVADVLSSLSEDFWSEETRQQALDLIGRWHARGDTALIYRNADLGHPELGDLVLLSYGGPSAQVSGEDFPEPPVSCPLDPPDGRLGWRYVLLAVCPPA